MSQAIDSYIVERTQIAYFSMEIAIRPEMKTYSGGLGILAGDTMRSSAELELPIVFVTLVSRAGYFRQVIGPKGQQEEPDIWHPEQFCQRVDAMIAVSIEGRPVWIMPWLYMHAGPRGQRVPVLLLDTDLDHNQPDDRKLTDELYGDGEIYRLKQEIILGLGGVRLLRALGFSARVYHLNEGHAALLTLDLLNRYRFPQEDIRPGEPVYDIPAVREHCVFTTHTPVDAGHDKFSYDMFQAVAPDLVEIAELKSLAGSDSLNMTRLALNLSGYTNGVARRHAETTEHLFPGYNIHAVTNGVHVGTWTHPAFGALFTSLWSNWNHDPEILVRAVQLPDQEVWRCHALAKSDLIAHCRKMTAVELDPDRATIGFARRMTGYKRPQLLFSSIERLVAIASRYPIQIVLAGKAHPKDEEGKQAIIQLLDVIDRLDGQIKCVFLPDYDMKTAQLLVSGVDIWLNTPLPPMEASGTSGMKAALNGVLNLSVLDGWWLEACIEGITGWAIGAEGDSHTTEVHSASLYEKLEHAVLPLYYDRPAEWRTMMKHSIAYIGYYFNSQRMMRRYATEAYLR